MICHMAHARRRRHELPALHGSSTVSVCRLRATAAITPDRVVLCVLLFNILSTPTHRYYSSAISVAEIFTIIMLYAYNYTGSTLPSYEYSTLAIALPTG